MSTYLFETEEHGALRRQAARFASENIAPHAHTWEEEEHFADDLYAKAAGAGLLGLGYPETLGGGGGDLSHVIVAGEAMVLAGKTVGTVVGLGSHGIALPPVVRWGTEEQKQKFARPVIEGRAVSALAVTEPGGGSDVANLKTRAVRDGDHYVVNGSKTFITSGTRANFITAAVRTGGEGHGGVSILLIEADTPGYRVGAKLKKTGWWASDTSELFFEDCRVPVAHRVGGENEGFLLLMQNFANERLLLAGQCVAIAQLALDESVAYAKQREAFGRSLSGFQVIRHKLADMSTRVAAARALTGDVITRTLAGELDPAYAAQAKNTATDACSWVVDQAVQIHGGYGYMREYVVERLFRDARLYPIGGGTREVMNEIICKARGF